MAGHSQGMEHIYVQEWLTSLLSSDPFIQGEITGGRVGESPIGSVPLPAIMFRLNPSEDIAPVVGFGRSMVEFIYAVEATAPVSSVASLLPTANRIDVLLTRRELTRNVQFVAGDGSILTIKAVYRVRPFSDSYIDEGTNNKYKAIGGEFKITASVQLTGDVIA